jgi:predicted ferric reductase
VRTRAGLTAWLLVYLGVLLAPLGLLLLASPLPGRGFWWEAGVGLGFVGLGILALQFFLTARFRRAAAPAGIDVIFAFHRGMAYVLVGILLLHVVLLAGHDPGRILDLLLPWRGGWEMGSGSVSLAAVLLLVLVSAFRKPLGVPYELWRGSHLLLGVMAVVLAFVHVLGLGTLSRSPGIGVAWLLLGGAVAAVVLRVRLLRPLAMLRRPWVLSSVRPDRGSCWTLVVDPAGHGGFRFQPGQFAWVTLRGSPFLMKEHPFSISSAPGPGGTLEFTVKELGDFTRTVGSLSPGSTVYVDGPYGAFTMDRFPSAEGYVFVAGGIGVAPVASMLRALAERGDSRPHLLVAAHPSWDAIPLRDALEAAAERLDLRRVYVLEDGRPGGPMAGPSAAAGVEAPSRAMTEAGLLSEDLLRRHLPPQPHRYVYFLCGPVPMIRVAEESLARMGVPSRRIQTELFDLV